MEELIKVGYGRADITPEESVPMGGYGNAMHRFSQEVRDKLMATCIAFTDPDNNTVLLTSVDALLFKTDLLQEIQAVLCAEFALPPHHIHVAATHSHSTPDTPIKRCPQIQNYRKKIVEGVIEAARKAMADRLPAVPYVAFAQTDRLNFIRHYKIADGTYAGANFGSYAAGVVGHASNNDSWVQAVKFDRIGGKPVLMVNYQSHPCFTGGVDKKVISADYIGELRKYLETKTASHFVFFQGAAGNHNARSFYARESRTNDAEEYAKLLGDTVLRALEAPVPIPGNQVRAAHRRLDLKLEHDDPALVARCNEIEAEWQQKGDRKLANEQAKEIGLNSIYAVTSVLRRIKLPESENMDIFAFRVGELGFACAPYEMFGASGMQIKEYAPYAMTFVVSCANDYHSYLASDLAFTHGCYEVDRRRYPRGTAELVANNFIEMLKEIK